MQNWAKEFKKWLGSDRLRVFTADSKSDIKAFCASKTYEVLIIGYERLRSVIDDLKKAQPPVGLIICDEGHRLKSSEAKTTQALRSLTTARRVILTGTPIQNNMAELWSLLHFIMPTLFDSHEEFNEWFSKDIESQSTKMHFL